MSAKIAAAFAIDRSVVVAVLGSARAILFGPLIIYLVATYFSDAGQGFYYAFLNLLALQSFLELGFGRLMVFFSSHEFAHLQLHNGHLIGDPKALDRLAGLLRAAYHWYIPAALGLPLLLIVLAEVMWPQVTGTDGISWRAPWVATALICGPRMFAIPFFSILEGCGQLYEVYRFRLIEGLLNSVALSALILANAQLWIFPISGAISLLISVGFLVWKYGRLFSDLHVLARSVSRFTWPEGLWPQQWRQAIMWLSMYLSSYLLVPGTLHFLGPVRAGQVGMAKNIIDSLLDLSTKWVYTRGPRLGTLVASARFLEFDLLFKRSLLGSIMALLSMILIGAGFYFGLSMYESSLTSRLGPTRDLIIMSMSAVFSLLIYAYQQFLLAHKLQPLTLLFFFQGAAMLLITLTVGHIDGAIVVGQLVVLCVFIFPITIIVAKKVRQEYRSANACNGATVKDASISP